MLKRAIAIMLALQFTCPYKLSTIIIIATRAIFGPLESFFMKCSQGTPLGELKHKLTLKNKLKWCL
jgi:hypothetical protein